MEFTDKVRDKMVDLSDRMDEAHEKRQEKKAKEEGDGEDAQNEEGGGDQESGEGS